MSHPTLLELGMSYSLIVKCFSCNRKVFWAFITEFLMEEKRRAIPSLFPCTLSDIRSLLFLAFITGLSSCVLFRDNGVTKSFSGDVSRVCPGRICLYPVQTPLDCKLKRGLFESIKGSCTCPPRLTFSFQTQSWHTQLWGTGDAHAEGLLPRSAASPSEMFMTEGEPALDLWLEKILQL